MSQNDESWIGGVHAVKELLKLHPDKILEIILARRRGDPVARDIQETASRSRIKVRISKHGEIDALLPKTNHQGVAARRSSAAYVDFDTVLKSAPRLWLVLDNIVDPGNLGAILRSAWAFGVGGVVIPKHRAAGLTAVAVKAAAGAADAVPICRVGNLSQALDTLRTAGVWIYGASSDAEQVLKEVDFAFPMALVLGSEGAGLRKGIQKSCDAMFRIPMEASAASVNVSVAAGIALAEIYSLSPIPYPLSPPESS